MRLKVYDETGRRVPRRLFPQLREGRHVMHSWINRLGQLKQDVARSAHLSFGKEIDSDEIGEAIEKVQALIGAAIPSRRCLCFQQDCPKCRGREWLSAGQSRKDSKPGHS